MKEACCGKVIIDYYLFSINCVFFYFCVFCETTIVFVENTTIYGDITGDGEVNRNDLLRLAKYFSGFGVEIN